MKPKNLIPLLFFCLASSSFALSQETKKVGEQLIEQLNVELKELNGNPDENQNDIANLRQYIQQIESSLKQKNNRSILQYLDNFGNLVPSEKVQLSLNAFKKALENETAANTQAYIAELEGTLTKAAETLTNADEPEDLDKTLESLNRNQFRNNGEENFDSNDPTIRRLVSELSSARQFVATWQDYIHASNSGNAQQSVQFLRNLSQQESSLVPRSQILARIAFEQGEEMDLTKALSEIKYLEDVGPCISKLSKRMSGSRSSYDTNGGQQEIFTALKQIEKAYQEYLSGTPVRVGNLAQSNDATEASALPVIVRLRADLLRLNIARALKLPAGTVLKDNESIEALINAATREAISRDDISAAIRIRQMRQAILRSSAADADGQALSEYAAAKLQIKAKQWMFAVVSLQKSLQSGSEFLPAEKIGELLESIRKDHPEEYQQAMKMLVPPTQQ